MNYATRYPRFWLSYFVLSVVVTLINALISIVGAIGTNSASALIGLVLGLAGLWPLFGYVRQRRCRPRWLWLALFAVGSGATAAVVVLSLYVAIANGSVVPVLVAGAVLLLGMPYLFALQQYLFKSPHIWQQT
jgi:hypothetical protein